VGAFLVNAAYDGKVVTTFEVLSEKGSLLRFISPWPEKSIRVIRSRDGERIEGRRDGDAWVVPTESGERYSIGAV
jgi:hypothetical protein